MPLLMTFSPGMVNNIKSKGKNNMATEIYLGIPPQHVVDWIESHSEPVPATHADTWYKYAGDTEWRTVSISGEIIGDYIEEEDDGTPTTQIPDVENVVALEIGTDVTRIGDYAFKYCTNLTSVTIGNSVTSIGVCAFAYCNGLASVTIPNGVTNIEG